MKNIMTTGTAKALIHGEAAAVLPTVACALSEQISTQWKRKIVSYYDGNNSFNLAGTTRVQQPTFWETLC